MKILSWLFIILGMAGLVGVRFMEDKIFYDPFLNYFHEANKQLAPPEFIWGRLVMSYIFRFLLNLFFSAIVVHSIFKDTSYTAQAAVMMLIVFAVAFPLYLYCIYTKFETGYLFSFYMRRFVIQPLILLLIIPIFYYRKYTMKP